MYKMIQEKHVGRVAGLRDIIDDVQQGRFPEPAHVVDAPDDLIETVTHTVDRGE